MASDAPYSSPAFGATMALRHGLQVGLAPDVLREISGGQARRLVERETPLDLGPAPGSDSLSRDPLLERVYSFLMNATGQMFHGIDPQETLALARLACDVGDETPHGPVYTAVLELLDARERLRAGLGRPAQPLRSGHPPHHRGRRARPHAGRAAARARAFYPPRRRVRPPDRPSGAELRTVGDADRQRAADLTQAAA